MLRYFSVVLSEVMLKGHYCICWTLNAIEIESESDSESSARLFDAFFRCDSVMMYFNALSHPATDSRRSATGRCRKSAHLALENCKGGVPRHSGLEKCTRSEWSSGYTVPDKNNTQNNKNEGNTGNSDDNDNSNKNQRNNGPVNAHLIAGPSTNY